MLSDHDQRILATLDADVADTPAGRTAARLRARFSVLQLHLATLLFSVIGYGGLAAAIGEDSRTAALLAIGVLTAAPTPTVLAYRYTDRDTSHRPPEGTTGGHRPHPPHGSTRPSVSPPAVEVARRRSLAAGRRQQPITGSANPATAAMTGVGRSRCPRRSGRSSSAAGSTARTGRTTSPAKALRPVPPGPATAGRGRGGSGPPHRHHPLQGVHQERHRQ